MLGGGALGPSGPSASRVIHSRMYWPFFPLRSKAVVPGLIESWWAAGSPPSASDPPLVSDTYTSAVQSLLFEVTSKWDRATDPDVFTIMPTPGLPTVLKSRSW